MQTIVEITQRWAVGQSSGVLVGGEECVYRNLTDLMVDLEGLAGTVSKEGIEMSFSFFAQSGLSQKSKQVIVAIAKEAISNIIQHSKAQRAEIKVAVLPSTVQLFIQDDGQGFSVNQAMRGEQKGLIQIYRQVASLRGNITVETGEDCGTALWINLPQLSS